MAAAQINPAAVGNLARLLLGGGLAVYGAANSLFNVEGGHRAIVFNRLVGIKETVSSARPVDAASRTSPSLETAVKASGAVRIECIKCNAWLTAQARAALS